MKLFLAGARLGWSLLLLPLVALLGARAEQPFSFAEAPGKLPKTVVPRHYHLRLEPNLAARTLAGTARIEIDAAAPAAQIVLNAHELEIVRASLIDNAAAPEPLTVNLDAGQQTLTLTPSAPLSAGRHVLELVYRGKINEQAQGLFFDKYTAPSGEKLMLGTQMEATDARRMFPCWDEPVFRATYDLTLVVPEHFVTASNMPLQQESPLPGGAKECVFAQSPVMPSYLVAIFAGEFETVAGEFDGIQLRILCTEGKRDTALYALEATKRILAYYHDYFGLRYPLPKLDQIAVPNAFSGFGAMENWGCISYADTYLLYDPASTSQAAREELFKTVAHEIAHQWFGNLVTMAWWDNLWLNEGFASWMETKCTDALNPDWHVWLRANASKETAMGLDARQTTHPIQQPVESEGQAFSAFDAISYLKGQAFLRMLEAYLGETAFRDGIRRYLERHAYSNTTTADLWAALTEASGQPVAAIAADWTERPGFPVVALGLKTDGDEPTLTLEQGRFMWSEPAPASGPWKIPLTYARLESLASPTVALLEKARGTLPWPAGDGALKANVGDAGFYRVLYDDALGEALRGAITRLPEVDQLNLIADAWAFVRAGRTSAPRYLELISQLGDSRSEPVCDNILGALAAIDGYEQGRPGRRAFQAWAVRFLQPLAQHLGWEPRPGESPLDGTLRASVITQLGVLGDDATIAAANHRFQAFLKDPSAIPGDLRGPVLFIVGRYADQATYDQLHELARKALTTEDKRRAYAGMQAALDPKLVAQTLALSLGDELGVSERNYNVQRVATTGEQVEAAWSFARDHFEELARSLTAFERYTYLPRILATDTDPARAAELEAYMKAHFPEEAWIHAARAAEGIRDRARVRDRELAVIDAWVKAQFGKMPE